MSFAAPVALTRVGDQKQPGWECRCRGTNPPYAQQHSGWVQEFATRGSVGQLQGKCQARKVFSRVKEGMGTAMLQRIPGHQSLMCRVCERCHLCDLV